MRIERVDPPAGSKWRVGDVFRLVTDEDGEFMLTSTEVVDGRLRSAVQLHPPGRASVLVCAGGWMTLMPRCIVLPLEGQG